MAPHRMKEADSTALMRVYKAWKRGPKNARSVSERSDVPYELAVTYLFWLRVAGGDPITARRFIGEHSGLMDLKELA